jgi:hypothetical protein
VAIGRCQPVCVYRSWIAAMISMAADDRGCQATASLSRMSKRNLLAAGPEAERPRRRVHRDLNPPVT